MSLIQSENGATEIIGSIMILGITMLGVSMLSIYGVNVIYNMQDLVDIKNAEQTLILFDSRTSMAALGQSSLGLTKVNLGGGSMAVLPNSADRESFVEIKSDSFRFVLPMGKMVYQLGDRIVAYEGGGLWSKYPWGSSMLSPPEFHFNGVTLTLPIIHIDGDTSIGGKGTATVSLKQKSHQIHYPNTSCADCGNRTNPLNNSISGRVYVNITSDFYDAWASYARTLDYTTVSTDPANRTAIIRLTIVPSSFGKNTSITNPIILRGLPPNDEPLTSFIFRLRPYGNNFNWDLRASSGDKKLIFHIQGSANSPGSQIDLNIGYQDDGKGYIKPAETWKGSNKLVVQEDEDGLYLDLDLLDPDINLTYYGKTVGTTSSCTPGKVNSGSFNNSGYSWGESLISGSTEKSLYDITQHYTWSMAQEGDILFYQCSPSGNQAPNADSQMLMNYTVSGALTYLHISENKAEVSIR